MRAFGMPRWSRTARRRTKPSILSRPASIASSFCSMLRQKKYFTHLRRNSNGQHKRHEVRGTGDLEKAKEEFKKAFTDGTGLDWENRADPPQEGRGIFLACSYGDDDFCSPASSQSSSPANVLSKPVCDVLCLLFNPKLKPAINGLFVALSAGRLKVNRLQVTNIRCELEQHCWKSSASFLANPMENSMPTIASSPTD